LVDKICSLFPAFGNEFTGSENQFILEFSSNAKEFFLEASVILKIDFELFNLTNENVIKDELTAQYLTYVYSSIISKVLKHHVKLSPYCAGYSMGLYSALFHSEAISFQDGILLIQKAFELINNDLKKLKYGMASVVGLDINDVDKILKKFEKKVLVANINNKTSFVISGVSEYIKKAVELFKKEGALSVKELPISTPYHTQFVTSATKNKFKDFIKKIKIKKPIFKIVSCLDQRIINSKEEISLELVNNLSKKQDWHSTMIKLINLKNDSFFEAGPGKSLAKISRFIDGEFKFYTIKEINEVIA